MHVFCEKEAGTVIKTYSLELCTCVPVYQCIADYVSVLVWSRPGARILCEGGGHRHQDLHPRAVYLCIADPVSVLVWSRPGARVL